MRRILFALVGIGLLGMLGLPAHGQTLICFKPTPTSTSCTPVSSTTPLPTTIVSGGAGAVTIANGADVALGSTTDAVGTTPSTGSAATLIALAKAINNNVSSSIPAGANLIGSVGIDQTTPGTTNGVQINAALPAGSSLLGKTGIDQTTPGTTNNVTTDGVIDAVSSSASATSAAVGATFSTSGYGSATFQIVANASANTIVVEGSNDSGTTWTSITFRSVSASSSGGIGATGSTAAGSGAFIISTIMPQIRWRISSFVSGTTTIAMGLKRSQSINLVDAYVGNNLGSATQAPVAPATATATKTDLLGCQYNTTPAAFTNGQQGRVSCDSSGSFFTSPGGFLFSNITTAATTTVKSGAGSVHTICVNALGTVASTITVYDNTAGSGTKIATINSLALLGCQTYDAAFATGLTLVTTGTVAPDVTVSFR